MMSIYSTSKTFCLAKTLFFSDLKSKYRESYLGYAWTLAPSLIVTFTFYVAYRSNVIQSSDLPLPYPVFAFSGVIFWQLFSELITSFSQGFFKSKNLLVKIKVDTDAILLSKIFDSLFDFVIKLIFLFIMLLIYDVPIRSSLAFIPLAVFVITISGTIIGLLICPFALLVQDLNRILPAVLSFSMFLTPIFYHSATGTIGKINSLNPIGQLIVASRALVYGEILITPYIIGIILSFIILLPLTYRFYNISVPIIIEKMGS